MLTLILLFFIFSDISLPSLGPSDYSSNSGPDISTRTTAGIFWSCFTTLIACTWTSVHPNIPARHISDWQLWWQRGKIFLIALVAPELIIHWALIQYRCSRQTVREFRILFPNSCGNLTYTHGMFLVMGGFMLIGENGRVSILQEPEIKVLLHNRKIIFPGISKDEIMDRSKADGLAKALALVQTTWFIAQVISRAVKHLPNTQLEITTVAFAFLNVLIYMLWWNKPQNVRYPIMVPLLKSSPSPHTHLISASMNGVHGGNTAHLPNSLEVTGPLLVPSLGADESETSPIELQAIPTKIQEANPSDLEQGSEPPMAVLDWPNSIALKLLRSYTELCRIGSWLIQSPAYLLCGLMDLFHTFHSAFSQPRQGLNSRLPPAGENVPIFYGGLSSDSKTPYLYMTSCIGALFGSIHCIAWASEFPSTIEQELWRIMSLCTTFSLLVMMIFISIPFLGTLLACFTLQNFASFHIFCSFLYFALYSILDLIFVIIALTYILARMLIFILALLPLRDLPAGTLEDVQWSKFVPHV